MENVKQDGSSTGLNFNLSQSKFLIFLAMLYTSIMLCNSILTNRWISLGPLFVFGGAFVSPLLFILGDIIAEIFGYRIARQIILFAFLCQTIFALMSDIVLHTPSPLDTDKKNAYFYVLGSLLRINISGFIAFFTSNLINIYIITKWKTMLAGRYFWLRSLGSSTIAEALYSAFAILMIAFGSLSFIIMIQIILISYLIKIGYSVIFAIPGNFLVNYLKYVFKIDVYDDSNLNFLSSLRKRKIEKIIFFD